MTTKRAVFLDRDGTLNEDNGYPCHLSQIHLYPFAFEAVRRIRRAGFAVIVVTHQSGVARGFIDEPALTQLHQGLAAQFSEAGAPLDGIYYCPHLGAAGDPGGCACAKPNPGLALRAAAELGLDLAGSYMVGDKADDVVFALNAGASPVLVLTGYGRASLHELKARRITPSHVASDLLHAVAWILRRERLPSFGHGRRR
jgi:D-glycero-D-manno-heptose 1,7-bisphosphate phosphatase